MNIPDQTERELFEAWAASEGGNIARHANATSRYASSTVQGWWKTWQARAALTPPQAGADGAVGVAPCVHVG